MEKALELFEEKRYSELRTHLRELKPADIALFLGELPREYMGVYFRILQKETAALTFIEMSTSEQEYLIDALTDAELKTMMDELFLDDTVDIIEEMPASVVNRILKNTDPYSRAKINELLNYPDDSAGSIMSVEFVYIKADMSVAAAFERIRTQGTDKETVYTCYVTDEARHLVGYVSVRTLLFASPDEIIGNIMNTDITSVTTTQDREYTARLFDKYDLMALPVVDNENRLVGIVTVDDAMDVLTEETEEDFQKMAAVSPVEDTYLKTSVFQHTRSRIVWLIVLLLLSVGTQLILTKYEEAFAVVPALVAFLPMLINTGGNCGSQSSTMVVRSLAIGEISTKDFFRVLFKEIRIGLISGVILSLAMFVLVVFIMGYEAEIGLTLGLSLIFSAMFAKSMGCILPMLAKKLRLDPAVIASPMITTLVDACSVLVYFNIAMLILKI